MEEYEYDFNVSKNAEPFIGKVNSTEELYGLPKNMLANLIQTESSFNPEALGPETKYGKAKGITQIIPQFHPDVDPYDPEASIDYAGEKLREYYDEFGNWDSAIAAWNAGPTNLRKHGLDGVKRIKEFKETQNYLKKINANRRVIQAQESLEPEEEEKAIEMAGGDTGGETDEFGGVRTSASNVDEFGGQKYTDDRGMKWEKPLPLGRRLIDDYARPVLQGIGGAAGIIIGGGGGAVGGSAVAPVAGTIAGGTAGGAAGGALGYSMANRVVDMLQEWLGYYEPMPVMLHMQKASEDVAEGLAAEMLPAGGAAVARGAKGVGGWLGKTRAGKYIGDLMPKTQKGAAKKAGEVLAAFTSNGPLIVQNMEEAKALEELIPGLKFDLGQMTGDVGIVKFMKEGVDDAGKLSVLRAERQLANTKAIQDFIEKTKGARGIDDPLRALKSIKSQIDEINSLAKKGLEKETTALRPETTPTQRGTTVRGFMEAGEKQARKKAEELFEKVPEQEQIVDDLVDGFSNILKPQHRTEGKDKFPKVLRDALEEMKKGGKVADDDAMKTARKVQESIEEQIPGETPTAHAYRIARSGKYTPAEARAKADILRKESDKLKDADKWQEGMFKAQEASNWREAAEAMEGAPQHKGWDKVPGEEMAEEVIEPTMSLKDIQGLRSEILEDLRTAKDKGYPRSYRKRLTQAVDLIDSKLGATAKNEYGSSIPGLAKKNPVAVKDPKTGKIYRGAIHGEILEKHGLSFDDFTGETFMTHLGFIDDTGKYIDRREATKRLGAGEASTLLSKKAKGKAPSQQLLEAQKYFRENVIEKYGKGTVGRVLRGEETVSDPMVADAFFKPGFKGEQAAADFMKVMGNNKEAMKAMKEHIDQKILDLRSPQTDEITKAALTRFLRNHQHAIKKLGLGKEYSTLYKARLAADEALARSKEFEKSAASAALKADVKDFIKTAFTKGSKKEAAIEMMKQMDEALKPFSKADRKRAVKGLQAAFIDEITSEIPLEGTTRELFAANKMADQFRKYDPALRVIFKDNPEKIKAMHSVRKAVSAVQYRTGEKAELGERYAADVFRRIAFMHGHSAVAAVDISRKMVRLLRHMSNEKVHKFVNQGILDPEFAFELMNAAKGGSQKKIDFKMQRIFTRLGLIAPQRKEEERSKR